MSRIILWQVQVAGWVQRAFSRRDDRGASLVEYALLLALIAVAAVGALEFLGGSVAKQVNDVAKTITSATTAPTG